MEFFLPDDPKTREKDLLILLAVLLTELELWIEVPLTRRPVLLAGLVPSIEPSVDVESEPSLAGVIVKPNKPPLNIPESFFP
jgi:hypothetical protein